MTGVADVIRGTTSVGRGVGGKDRCGVFGANNHFNRGPKNNRQRLILVIICTNNYDIVRRRVRRLVVWRPFATRRPKVGRGRTLPGRGKGAGRVESGTVPSHPPLFPWCPPSDSERLFSSLLDVRSLGGLTRPAPVLHTDILRILGWTTAMRPTWPTTHASETSLAPTRGRGRRDERPSGVECTGGLRGKRAAGRLVRHLTPGRTPPKCHQSPVESLCHSTRDTLSSSVETGLTKGVNDPRVVRSPVSHDSICFPSEEDP